MILVKSHGLGNDYLVLDRWDEGLALPAGGGLLSPAMATALCDRHFGPGADGVLEPMPSTRADYGLRIWNPDGSLAEKSGNGLRIFSRWLVDHRGAPLQHSVEVPGGVVRCQVTDDGISVEMGRATFEPAEVPVALPLRDTPVDLGGHTLAVTAVGLGNPHCVSFFEEDLDSLPWRDWGRALERHPLFPNRTNVQLARVRSPSEVEARIWERGAGETAASGSSACAVAVAAYASGRASASVTVHMPGGALFVAVAPDLSVRLHGPVEELATITLSTAFVTKLMVNR